MSKTTQLIAISGPVADNPNVMTAGPRDSRQPSDIGFIEQR